MSRFSTSHRTQPFDSTFNLNQHNPYVEKNARIQSLQPGFTLRTCSSLLQACLCAVRCAQALRRLALCDPWLQPEVVHSNTHIKKRAPFGSQKASRCPLPVAPQPLPKGHCHLTLFLSFTTAKRSM